MAGCRRMAGRWSGPMITQSDEIPSMIRHMSLILQKDHHASDLLGHFQTKVRSLVLSDKVMATFGQIDDLVSGTWVELVGHFLGQCPDMTNEDPVRTRTIVRGLYSPDSCPTVRTCEKDLVQKLLSAYGSAEGG